MFRITTESGRVGHVLDSVVTGPEGRVVTTACGKTQPEKDFKSAEGLDDCGACDKKFSKVADEAPAAPKEAEKAAKETETEEVVEAETVEEEKPRSTSKK